MFGGSDIFCPRFLIQLLSILAMAALGTASPTLLAQRAFQRANAAAYARQGDEALNAQSYDLAIDAYREALSINPSLDAVWSNMGAALFAQGNFSKASDAFIHAYNLAPKNPDYSFNAALALVRQDKCRPAVPYLHASAGSFQHRASALYLEGMCAYVEGRWETAESKMAQAEENGSRSAETYYVLVYASRRSGDPASAERAFNSLKEHYPESSYYHEIVGEALDRGEQDNQALHEMSEAIASNPQAPGLHAQFGFLLWKTHRLTEAKQAFQQELAIDPHSYSALYYLGDIAEQTNQLDQALAWNEQAVHEQPQSAKAHFAVGRVLARLGRDTEALKELQACFPSMDKDATAHYWTANVLKKLGRSELASQQMARVREINQAERIATLNKLGNGVR